MAKINSFVILDFETGGLSSQKNPITEVAALAIKGDTFEKIDLVSTYVKPYGEYTYEDAALKATGITFQDIENGISVKEAVQELIDLFKKADLYGGRGTKPILVAHNSGFDKGFLQQIFHHCGKMKELEKLVYGTFDFYNHFQPEFLDSIILAKMMWGNDEEMTKYNLGSCITKAGLELADAHLAINDVIGLKELFEVVAKKMRAENASSNVTVNRYRDHFQF
jgi:DNA polymerase III epsilon subunit-like protein